MSPIYDVQTSKFGTIQVEKTSIKEARDWAKKALKLGPQCVSAHREYKYCEECQSKPCCCKEK